MGICGEHKPITIAFEGLDGSGKSTCILVLKEKIKIIGFKVCIFQYTASREDIIGKLIRWIYKTKHPSSFIRDLLIKYRIIQEILYNIQARKNYLEIPNRKVSDVIIFDRCAITAFIAHTNKLGDLLIPQSLLSCLETKFVPDYVIYLKISSRVALDRIEGRSQATWADEELVKLQVMEQNYNRLVDGSWCPSPLSKIMRWYVIDGNRPKDDVKKEIEDIFSQILVLHETRK